MSKYQYRIIEGENSKGIRTFFVEGKKTTETKWHRYSWDYDVESYDSVEGAFARARRAVQQYQEIDRRQDSDGELEPTEKVVEIYE